MNDVEGHAFTGTVHGDGVFTLTCECGEWEYTVSTADDSNVIYALQHLADAGRDHLVSVLSKRLRDRA